MAVALDSLKDTTETLKVQRRRIIVSVIVVSIIVHLLAGVAATIWIVARYFAPPEATFVAKKMVALPPKIIDPKMAAAELEAAAPKPVLDQQIASLRATDFALPDVPRMEVDQVVEFDPSTMVSEQMTSALAGTGGGGGAGAGGSNGEGSAMNFFGLKTSGRSMIVIFDVSLSVLNKADKAGVSITRIREETAKLLDSLTIHTMFNLFQFSRYYQPLSDQMIAPTDENRKKARAWLDNEFRTDGSLPRSVRGVRSPRGGEDNGIVFVLREALALRPDVIFLISDGSFQSEQHGGQVPWDLVEGVIEEAEKSSGHETVIHFIGFEVKPDDRKELKRIIRHTGGDMREVDG